MANPTFDITVTGIPAKPKGLSLPAWLVLIRIVTFTVLLVAGAAIWKNAPPIPTTVRSFQQEVTTLFFSVAMALFFMQILMGMVTAHYAVEGDGFYGIPLQQFLILPPQL